MSASATSCGAGIGRKTRQYNPSSNDVTSGATNLGAWMNAVASIKGEGGTMAVSEAVALIHATPPEARSEFARDVVQAQKQVRTERAEGCAAVMIDPGVQVQVCGYTSLWLINAALLYVDDPPQASRFESGCETEICDFRWDRDLTA
jgi:hypothetical protein